MKKYIFILAGLFFFSNTEYSEAANIQLVKSNDAAKVSVKTENFGGGRKGKNGRYRKSKGFLWGLFKGKNQCDCPKH